MLNNSDNINSINGHLINSPLRLNSHKLADVVQGVSELVLFLDIDGTLSEFHPDPQQSFIAKDNLEGLAKLQTYIPIWLVTGRSVADASRLMSPLTLPVIGSHGLECHTLTSTYSLVPIDLNQLAQIKQRVVKATATNPNWRIEQKPFGVALHFREHPELANDAFTIMRSIHEQFNNWQLKAGKCVYEILPNGVDKGSAINHILEQYYPDRCPIFIGDDVTDEAGFIAVQGCFDKCKPQGVGIKVGHEPTRAHYYVSDVPAVTALLKGLLNLCQS